MESDLSQYHRIDYRDRWRFDEHGVRRLTLRMILVRVRHLPPDAATPVALGGDGFTRTDLLLMDVFHAQAGNPHPSKPKQSAIKQYDPDRERRRRSAHRRARERQAAIDAGEIT